MKIDVTKTLSVLGAVVGIAGSIISTVATSKQMKVDIAEEVAKQLNK